MPIKPAPILCALALAASFAAASARAQTGPSTLNICNRSIIGVSFAVSYREAPGSSRWVAEGWRHLPVDACAILQVPSADDIYLYAVDGDTVWGGEAEVCIDQARDFRRVYTPGEPCTDGALVGFGAKNLQGLASDTINLTDEE